MKTFIINIPFQGFYESHYSSAIDEEESRFAEYVVEKTESEYPEALRLDQGEITDALMRASTYEIAFERIAHEYVEEFSAQIGEALGFEKGLLLAFESMSSPKYYNFETDRIFAHIPAAIVRQIFARSESENHKTLRAVIRERFTSRDGFISHYSNDFADWSEKPLESWDHNELGTLLLATMRAAEIGDDYSWDIYESLAYGESFYQAWDSCVDWSEYESRLEDERASKLESWIEDDKESAVRWMQNNYPAAETLIARESSLTGVLDGVPIRCPNTLELPF